jgi:hypothetical protein
MAEGYVDGRRHGCASITTSEAAEFILVVSSSAYRMIISNVYRLIAHSSPRYPNATVLDP